MVEERSRTRIESLLRWILALAFAVAAGLKLAQAPEGESMFSVLPQAVRTALVAIELSLAGLLVSRHFPRFSAAATALLLCTFLAAILFELTRANPRPCGCFGAPVSVRSAEGVRQMLWTTLVFDSLLLIAALAVLFMPARRTAPQEIP
jgi:hypothetical protein